MDQKPSIGRIVHYFVNRAVKDGQPYPAIITHVFSETCVNLFVFSDATYPFDGQLRSSVVRGDGPGCWDWPPRV